ncbi:hypothetical protein HDU93_000189 [Gonapodya sp. JEL0774]|nr:hypothetical protein HDU93_000189 [Gonapodya sp. JEL0774]
MVDSAVWTRIQHQLHQDVGKNSEAPSPGTPNSHSETELLEQTFQQGKASKSRPASASSKIPLGLTGPDVPPRRAPSRHTEDEPEKSGERRRKMDDSVAGESPRGRKRRKGQRGVTPEHLVDEAPLAAAVRSSNTEYHVDEYSEDDGSSSDAEHEPVSMRINNSSIPFEESHGTEVPMLELARAALNASRAESQRDSGQSSSEASIDQGKDEHYLAMRMDGSDSRDPREPKLNDQTSSAAPTDMSEFVMPRLPPIAGPGESALLQSHVLPPISTISPRLQPTAPPRTNHFPPPLPHSLPPSIGLSPALTPATTTAGSSGVESYSTVSGTANSFISQSNAPSPPSAHLLQSPPISPDLNSFFGNITYSGGFSFLQNVPPITPALLPEASPYSSRGANFVSPMTYSSGLDTKRQESGSGMSFYAPLPASAVGMAGMSEHSRSHSGTGDEPRGMRITDLLFPVSGTKQYGTTSGGKLMPMAAL